MLAIMHNVGQSAVEKTFDHYVHMHAKGTNVSCHVFGSIVLYDMTRIAYSGGATYRETTSGRQDGWLVDFLAIQVSTFDECSARALGCWTRLEDRRLGTSAANMSVVRLLPHISPGYSIHATVPPLCQLRKDYSTR